MKLHLSLLKIAVASVLTLVCLSWSGNALAQTAQISGTITDSSGAVVPKAAVTVFNKDQGEKRITESDGEGYYIVQLLKPGNYMVKVQATGFGPIVQDNITLLVGQSASLSFKLQVGAVEERVAVSGEAPLLELTTSSVSSTITPHQIQHMPINGRNYLDLLQLVPGVALNRQIDVGSDGAAPILGERGGNTQYLIDGLPNRDEVDGGAAGQLNQDAVLEFQVLTTGYKAEYGHGSGGIVNVVTRSGTNDWHGGASFFHRNYKLDSADVPGTNAPFLLRWDPSAQIGGPIKKDRIFFFGSVERILESRQLNFQFPTNTPSFLVVQEAPFDLHTKIFDTRSRVKLDEQVGHHRLTQQANYTNTHTGGFQSLQASAFLPSTRYSFGSRRLMLGFSDTATLGNQSDPFILSLYGQYRGENSLKRPSYPGAHADSGVAQVSFGEFSSYSTGNFSGDLGSVKFGAGFTQLPLEEKYASFGANLAKAYGRHNIKFGWDLQRTMVDGTEAHNILNQLNATIPDYVQFGPIFSGVYYTQDIGGATPQDDLIRLRNNFNGLFFQDDWKLAKTLTLNAGIRWDYDNRFPNKTNFSPRIGLAWAVTPKTVIDASWGYFYDHYRLGLARDVGAFGGATVQNNQYLSIPRLFYGNPSVIFPVWSTIAAGVFGDATLVPCAASDLTDAQIAGAPCPFLPPPGGGNPYVPYYGIDHLNSVVAPGHAPIPANSVVSISNVQALTGLTPQQFADQASIAVGLPPGYYTWDKFGALTNSSIFVMAGIVSLPVSVSPDFKVPYTDNVHVGFQREITQDLLIQADYNHKKIHNILGVIEKNINFLARVGGPTTLPGTPGAFVNTYGPWFSGTYDGLTVGFTKRMSHHFTLQGNYTWTHAIDNVLNSTFVSDVQSNAGLGMISHYGPSDNFIGVPPVVTFQVVDPNTGTVTGTLTNANGSFVTPQGNYVPKAGVYYYGPNLDKGPSDLGLNHAFLLHGVVQLPVGFEFSGIFRAQSGFHYSQGWAPDMIGDVDGDSSIQGMDFRVGRDHFTAPAYVDMDLRVAKNFRVTERVGIHAYLEFFNLLNGANPAAVQTKPGIASIPFGSVTQVLPGREGQVGIRFDF